MFAAELAARVPTASVGQRLRTVYGGVARGARPTRSATVLTLPGVVAVQADALRQPLTDSSPTFIGATTLYPQLGGTEHAGKGVIVGVLDTGAGRSIRPSPTRASSPRRRPRPTARPAPATSATTRSRRRATVPLQPQADRRQGVPGHLQRRDPAARSTPTPPGTPTGTAPTPQRPRPVTRSARRSCSASTAGRSPASRPARGRPSTRSAAPSGCFPSDSAAAVAQAISDGVKVINFSISGGTQPYTDPVELAFLDAYAAGVFVAASAGNDGPGAATTNHLRPWVTTVAASTQTPRVRSPRSPARRGRHHGHAHGRVDHRRRRRRCRWSAPPTPPTHARCADARRRRTLHRQDRRCASAAATPGSRRASTSCTAARSAWCSTTPTLLGHRDRQPLAAGGPPGRRRRAPGVPRSAPGASPRRSPRAPRPAGQGDVMAAFSSRGPGGDFLKPDVTAPGVQILAGNTPTPESGRRPARPVLPGDRRHLDVVAARGRRGRAAAPCTRTGRRARSSRPSMTTATTTVVKEDSTPRPTRSTSAPAGST